jgi:hypothetical protein
LEPVLRPLSVTLNNGAAANVTDDDEGLGPVGTAGALVDIFLDGMLVEAFANGGEAALTGSHPAAALATAMITVTGSVGSAPVAVSISAWAMQPSIDDSVQSTGL